MKMGDGGTRPAYNVQFVGIGLTLWMALGFLVQQYGDVPVEETLSALTDLQRAGTIRAFGSSTFPGWQIVEAGHGGYIFPSMPRW